MAGNPAPVRAAIENQSILWGVAILFYGFGDTATTLVGLYSPGTEETGPVALTVIAHGGIPGFLALKIGFISVCVLAWYAAPTPGRVAIPLALAVVGTGVTCWNLLVVLS